MCWLCDHPDRSTDDFLLEVVMPAVDRLGWTVIAVGADPPLAALAYTVGLTARGLPELVVRGLDVRAAWELLETAVTQVLEDGPPGQGRWELLGGPTLIARRAGTGPLAVARRLYGGRTRAVSLRAA